MKTILTKYDYLGENKRVLTHDGKTPSILLIPNFNGNLFQELGEANALKGKALKDYLLLRNSQKGDAA